jgi:phosphoadenosine phosphosulfate reductase
MSNPEPMIEQALAESANAAFTCSFQAEDMVALDYIRRIEPSIPVVFLETGYHFPETYAYRDRMVRLWNLNLVNAMPRVTVAEQEGQLGKLYVLQPDRCCGIRKVEPLFRTLEDYDVWFTGLRREQSPTRAGLEAFGSHRLPSGKILTKVSPLFDWTWKDVWAYMTIHEIPHLPLYDRGYTSIGCQPCTAPPDGDDLRSGRWGGKKLECGIHIEAPASVVTA